MSRRKPYNKYNLYDYRSNKWFKKRKVILKRDEFTCAMCGDKEELTIHHTYYESGRHVWDYPNGTLKTFCRTCHDFYHNTHTTIRDRKIFTYTFKGL